MDLNRFTKIQLIKKLEGEEKLTSQLEVDVEEAEKRIKELEQISTETLQTAQRASRAVETFRYSMERELRLGSFLATTTRGLVGSMDATTEANVIRDNIIQNLRKLSGPVIICPKCGHVLRSKEPDVLLCDACMKARTKPKPD